MASVLSNYAGNAALAMLLTSNTGLYLALHTSDPTPAALLATEVAGGGYARQPITMSTASSKTCGSTNAQVFAGMPVVTIPYMAVWDALGSGHMIFSVLLGTPLVTTLSGQVLVAVGDIAVSL